jgi:hypothetical protein
VSTSELASAPAHDAEIRSDDVLEFRLGQLLILLSTAQEVKQDLNLERLGIFDFLAANPFLVITEDQVEYRHLLLAGFSSRPLTYASPGHRFITRRDRLQHDLSYLVAYGMCSVVAVGGERRYALTEFGMQSSDQFSALYAQAYKSAALLILRKLGKYSDSKLRSELSNWLKTDPILLDLFG